MTDNNHSDIPAYYAPRWFQVLDRVVAGFALLFLPLCFLAMTGYLGQALFTLFAY